MKQITFLTRNAFKLSIGLMILGVFPSLAPAQQNQVPKAEAEASCARLLEPLERRLKEAGPQLKQAEIAKTQEDARSRLLFEILSDAKMQKTISMTLACLAAERQ